MITKEYRHNTEFHSTDLNKSYVKAGFVSVAASLLVLLSAIEPQPFDLTITAAFAQDSDSARRNQSALLSLPGATTMTNGLNSTLVDFASNIEQIRGHLNAAVMNKEAGNNTLVFMQASSTIPQEMDPEVQETKQFFSDINNSIQNKSSPEVVDKSIEAAIREISEITGISKESLGGQTAGTESGEIISEIRSLLNQTVEAYRQQNYKEAEALATTAYLDNFEFIEAPLAEKDEALMENTEVMLREQLRELIQNKVSLEELQQHIDKINSNLDKAEELLVDRTTP